MALQIVPYNSTKFITTSTMNCTSSVLREDLVDKLIEEVEARPALYAKSSKEYADPVLKKKLWEEVNAAVLDNWDTLSPQEKLHEACNIKKRWENLRTCFCREIRAQIKAKSGLASYKRRKYLYFDKLQFLLPEVRQKSTASNFDFENIVVDGSVEGVMNCSENEQEDEEETREDENYEVDNKNEIIRTIERRRTNETPSYGEPLDWLPVKQKVESVLVQDEETHFVLSLVPTLKSLPEANKLLARIEILSVLQKMKYDTP